MEPIARPVWTPKKVANDASIRAISMATRPNSSGLPPAAAVTLHPEPADVQLLERRQQLERKRVLDPVLVDDRRDLRLHERAHLLHDRQFLGGQVLSELVEVAVRRRQWLSVPCPVRSCALVSMVLLRSWLCPRSGWCVWFHQVIIRQRPLSPSPRLGSVANIRRFLTVRVQRRPRR